MDSITGKAPNIPATRIFRELQATLQNDATSPQVDLLAAELATHVARAGWVRLALVEGAKLKKFYSLVYVMQPFGVVLEHKRREANDGTEFIDARLEQPTASEYAGAAWQGQPVAQGAAA